MAPHLMGRTQTRKVSQVYEGLINLLIVLGDISFLDKWQDKKLVPWGHNNNMLNNCVDRLDDEWLW